MHHPLVGIIGTIAVFIIRHGAKKQLEFLDGYKELKPPGFLLVLGLVLLFLGFYFPFKITSIGIQFSENQLNGLLLMLVTILPGSYILIYFFNRRIKYSATEIISRTIYRKVNIGTKNDIISQTKKPILSKDMISFRDGSTINVDYSLIGSIELIKLIEDELAT